jgi:galactokinase/mevalonate kinase-like predicted kinase
MRCLRTEGDRSRPGNLPRGPSLSRSTAAAKPIGKQDQYAAAYGGIRDFRFGPADRVDVERITPSHQLRRVISNELLLFYTGITRSVNAILNEQSSNTANRLPELARLCDLAGEAADGLRSGDIDAVGIAMNKSWEVKRTLASGVTNSQIDQAVERALAAGHGSQGDRRWRWRVPTRRMPARTATRSARCTIEYAGVADHD